MACVRLLNMTWVSPLCGTKVRYEDAAGVFYVCVLALLSYIAHNKYTVWYEKEKKAHASFP